MDDSTPSPTPDSPPPEKEARDTPKAKKQLHVVSVPHEDDMIAQEMAELFEEDQVTHKHGSAEPEGD